MLRAWVRRALAAATLVERCVRRAARWSEQRRVRPYQITCMICGESSRVIVRRGPRRLKCDRCHGSGYIVFGNGKWGTRVRAYLRGGNGEAAAAAAFLRRLHLMINGQEGYQ
jgi:hypothetical protein